MPLDINLFRADKPGGNPDLIRESQRTFPSPAEARGAAGAPPRAPGGASGDGELGPDPTPRSPSPPCDPPAAPHRAQAGASRTPASWMP